VELEERREQRELVRKAREAKERDKLELLRQVKTESELLFYRLQHQKSYE